MHLQLPTVPFDQSAERRLVAEFQRVKQRVFGQAGPRGCLGAAPIATGRPGALIPSHLINDRTARANNSLRRCSDEFFCPHPFYR